MSYTLNGTVEFIAPLFIREGGYWENHMLPYLEAEGWKVIVVDCAGVKTTLDFAYRLVESIESVYAIPDDFNLRWASEDACLIDWFDMRQGLFVLYKNFDDLFVMDDEDVSLCVNIIEQMDTRYTVRPIHGSGLYQVLLVGIRNLAGECAACRRVFRGQGCVRHGRGRISLVTCGKV